MRKARTIATVLSAVALGWLAWAGPSTLTEPGCGPGYRHLFDLAGNTLPPDTPYIAWVERDTDSATVYRQTPGDIDALIARLRAEGEVADPLLTASYWQAVRCRKVGERCEGTCPDGRRCSLETASTPKPKPPQPKPTNPKPPKPKPKPVPKAKKKKLPHEDHPGEPREFAQTKTIRCICQ
jgi:hypothetical protein